MALPHTTRTSVQICLNIAIISLGLCTKVTKVLIKSFMNVIDKGFAFLSTVGFYFIWSNNLQRWECNLPNNIPPGLQRVNLRIREEGVRGPNT